MTNWIGDTILFGALAYLAFLLWRDHRRTKRIRKGRAERRAARAREERADV